MVKNINTISKDVDAIKKNVAGIDLVMNERLNDISLGLRGLINMVEVLYEFKTREASSVKRFIDERIEAKEKMEKELEDKK